jgi:hypothetical protein
MFALAAAGLSSVVAPAQSYRSSEDELKAVSLLNLTKFVEWPDGSFDDAQAPIMFGILGGDPWVGLHLRRMAAGEKLQGRNVVIRNKRFGDDLRGCHVLFVGTSERQHIPQILASLQSANVLTISDLKGFADAGGVVQMEMEQGRARFVVNLDAATQSKLHFSAKLLALARVINHSEAAR